MSLLSDASPAEILTSTASPAASTDDLSEEELTRAKTIVMASYNFAAQSRRAAKSVLATAITKAEVVAICAKLIGGHDRSEIIRASDIILPTAATRKLGNLAKENIFSAIASKRSWMKDEEVDMIGRFMGEVSETSEALEILRTTMTGKLLTTSFDDIVNCESSKNQNYCSGK